MVWFIFFFSSRRRHTRYWRDWSSDVCSSDLGPGGAGRRARRGADRAAAVPRRELHGRRPDLLVRGRHAGRVRQPVRGGPGRLDHRRGRDAGRLLRRLHRGRTEDPRPARDHLRRPAVPAQRPVRRPGCGQGMSGLALPPRLRPAALVAVLVLAVLVPFALGSFRVGQLTQVLCYAIAVLGLNLLTGYSGQISLGHGAFFALGAYTTAILIQD